MTIETATCLLNALVTISEALRYASENKTIKVVIAEIVEAIAADPIDN